MIIFRGKFEGKKRQKNMERLIIYPSWESMPPVAQLSVLKTNNSAISIIVFL